MAPHDSHASGVAESLADFARRVAEVPAVVSALARSPMPHRAADCPSRAFVVSGVGGSEAPARLLVASLEAAGRRARFVPLSAFVAGDEIGNEDEVLCLFSQGLSPNARAALSRAHELAEAYLFTSAPADAPSLASFAADGGKIVSLPPATESPTLLRLVGPAAAMLGAIRFAGEPHDLPALERSLAAAATRGAAIVSSLDAEILRARLAWITCGVERRLADGLAIKWLEGLARETPVWDAVGFAHGPFHAFYTDPALLVAIGPPSPLFDALESMLVAPRHRAIRFEPKLPFPLARLEIEVFANALFLGAFEASPRDVFDFPSKGRDGALYGLAHPLRPPRP